MSVFLELIGGGATEDCQHTEGKPSPVTEDGQTVALIAVVFGACLIVSETPRMKGFRNLVLTLVQWFLTLFRSDGAV